MIRSSLSVLALLIAAPVNAAPIDAASVAQLVAGKDAETQPGCAVGIFRRDGAPLVTGFGLADMDTHRRIDGDTRFYAASVSKQFTAIAAAQLVAAGKLSMDDEIHKFLPELPRYSAPVTVAMLMHHVSGIPDSLTVARLAGFPSSRAASRAQTLALVFGLKETNFPPGTRFEYSNGGYLLLSEIVERVAKKPFAAYVGEKILRPLGMTRSYVLDGAPVPDDNMAQGYAVGHDAFDVRDTYPGYGGSGGVVLTMNDLARYDRDIHVGRRIFTPAVEKIVSEPGRYSNGRLARTTASGDVYAGGVFIGGDWTEHTGGAEGFKNIYARLPAAKLGIGLLCNRSDAAPTEKARKIVTAIGGLPAMESRPYPALVPVTGRFASPGLPVFYDLVEDGKRLTVTLVPRNPPAASPLEGFTLKLDEDGHFVSESGDVRLTLIEGGDAFLLKSGDFTARLDHVR